MERAQREKNIRSSPCSEKVNGGEGRREEKKVGKFMMPICFLLVDA